MEVVHDAYRLSPWADRSKTLLSGQCLKAYRRYCYSEDVRKSMVVHTLLLMVREDAPKRGAKSEV